MKLFYEVIINEEEKRAWMYKQKNSKNYYLAIKEKGVETRISLRESDYKKALMKAGVYCDDGIESIKERVKKKKETIKIKKLCDIAVKDEEKIGAKMSVDYIRNIKKIKNKIGDENAKDLNKEHIRKYINDHTNSKTTATVTKSCFKKIIQVAIRKKVFTDWNAPKLPKSTKTQKQKNRDFFNKEQMDLINDNENWNDFIQKSRNKITQKNRELLKLYVDFMLATGVRPGLEVETIKYKRLTMHPIVGAHLLPYTLKIKEGKTNEREISIQLNAVIILDELLKYHKGNKDNYLFRKNDEQEKRPQFYRFFKQYLDHLGIDKTNKDLYSIRHTFITQKLIEKSGSNIHVLAKHCGNSVSMIEEYYDKVSALDYIDDIY